MHPLDRPPNVEKPPSSEADELDTLQQLIRRLQVDPGRFSIAVGTLRQSGNLIPWDGYQEFLLVRDLRCSTIGWTIFIDELSCVVQKLETVRINIRPGKEKAEENAEQLSHEPRGAEIEVHHRTESRSFCGEIANDTTIETTEECKVVPSIPGWWGFNFENELAGR